MNIAVMHARTPGPSDASNQSNASQIEALRQALLSSCRGPHCENMQLHDLIWDEGCHRYNPCLTMHGIKQN